MVKHCIPTGDAAPIRGHVRPSSRYVAKLHYNLKFRSLGSTHHYGEEKKMVAGDSVLTTES